ncbi:alkyl hydroperoxide reductase [Streptomyces antioxidans]|uniref:thioredoxin-dependent peroxiredoxin n=1 Tax=Streptomyces antioxidans TaxID=1507734 RepID=A0A1V4DBN1_9ACTN|nr:peroxiredoxin-like family protein [Streptomyces antioxidans]OPF83741.1 alkyl hydroperoxide reductase [Streptomyces antioxidans]
MSLEDELRAFREVQHRQDAAGARAVKERAARELAESGQAERALAVGARAPHFRLPSATGGTLALEDLLSAGAPVVLTFYRGAWCPYCNMTLRSLQRHHKDITARGARLVAISPQRPDESLSQSQKHQLAFDVLSDIGSATARRYGLAFEVSEELAAHYARSGLDLERVNDGHARVLPIPATYVIDRSGTVRWAFVDTDFTVRAEPADILAALDALG